MFFKSPPTTGSQGFKFSSVRDVTSNLPLVAIGAHKDFQKKSHEEIRWEDYTRTNPAQTPWGSNPTGQPYSVNPKPVWPGNSTPAPNPFTVNQTPSPNKIQNIFNPAPAPATNIFNPSPKPTTNIFNPTPTQSANIFNPTPSSFNPTPAPATNIFNPTPTQSANIFNPTPTPSSFNPTPSPATNIFNPTPAPSTNIFNPAPTPSSFNPSPKPTTNIFNITPDMFSGFSPAGLSSQPTGNDFSTSSSFSFEPPKITPAAPIFSFDSQKVAPAVVCLPQKKDMQVQTDPCVSEPPKTAEPASLDPFALAGFAYKNVAGLQITSSGRHVECAPVLTSFAQRNTSSPFNTPIFAMGRKPQPRRMFSSAVRKF